MLPRDIGGLSSSRCCCYSEAVKNITRLKIHLIQYCSIFFQVDSNYEGGKLAARTTIFLCESTNCYGFTLAMRHFDCDLWWR